MLEIEIIKKKGIDVIDSKLLHKKLEVKSYHADWIRRRIENYGFIENKDYYIEQFSTVRGGTKRKVYLMTVDMCKHLSMIENNHTGQKVREYFIEVEKQFRKQETIRLAGIQVRRSLTDSVRDSGEQERMHNRGYSTYTLMVYEITGLKKRYMEYRDYKKKYPEEKTRPFREMVQPSELKQIELAESLIKPLLELDKQYSEIKETLKPLFERKELK